VNSNSDFTHSAPARHQDSALLGDLKNTLSYLCKEKRIETTSSGCLIRFKGLVNATIPAARVRKYPRVTGKSIVKQDFVFATNFVVSIVNFT
jgi:hypothetical protein